jgi:hypothetical protein
MIDTYGHLERTFQTSRETIDAVLQFCWHSRQLRQLPRWHDLRKSVVGALLHILRSGGLQVIPMRLLTDDTNSTSNDKVAATVRADTCGCPCPGRTRGCAPHQGHVTFLNANRVLLLVPRPAWECMTWRLRLHYRPEFRMDTGQSPEDIGSQTEPGNQENESFVPIINKDRSVMQGSRTGCRGDWRVAQG